MSPLLLKKGWAKRWFSLSPTGVLSYSTSPSSVIRGSIQIMVSTISYNPKLRQIHIDSGTMIYHLKTLTQEDYDTWSTALRERNYIQEQQIDQEVPSTQSGFSLSNSKRISSRSLNMYNQNDKKLKAEIEQAAETTSNCQQIITQLVQTLDQLQPYLQSIPAELAHSLEQQKLAAISSVQEQEIQWRNVQNCFFKNRRSGSVSPVVGSSTPQKSTILEHDEPSLHRCASVYSQVSGYSEQFFDAEDIELSEDEDEFIVDHTSSIDDGASSEEETGDFILFYFIFIS